MLRLDLIALPNAVGGDLDAASTLPGELRDNPGEAPTEQVAGLRADSRSTCPETAPRVHRGRFSDQLAAFLDDAC